MWPEKIEMAQQIQNSVELLKVNLKDDGSHVCDCECYSITASGAYIFPSLDVGGEYGVLPSDCEVKIVLTACPCNSEGVKQDPVYVGATKGRGGEYSVGGLPPATTGGWYIQTYIICSVDNSIMGWSEESWVPNG